MIRRTLLLSAALIAGGIRIVPATAQAPTGAPLRFGLAYAAGRPFGEFARLVDAPAGFTAWLSLPFSRTSWLGLRGEFSVLTVPEERVAVSLPENEAEITVSLRSTIGFTGVGPRAEATVGPVVVAGAVMAGLTRIITDLTGRVTVEGQLYSVGLSESDNALAAKATLDVYVPIIRGRRDAALGFAAGVDWTTSGRMGYPEQGSFAINPNGDLVVNRVEAPMALVVWRVGLGMVF